MYKNIKLLALLTFIFMISACSRPSLLQYDKSNLNLQLEDKRIQVPSTQIQLKIVNFGSLFLEQKLLRLDDGSLVMYEEAETDMQYMFQPTTKRIISVVFDAIKVINIYEKDYISAYQLVLKDRRILNIIVAQVFDQELQMVYGMSSKQYVNTLNRLGADINGLPYSTTIELKNEPEPLLSKWTMSKVMFEPLVIPMLRSGRP